MSALLKKPRQWAFNPGLVDKKWAWLWKNIDVNISLAASATLREAFVFRPPVDPQYGYVLSRVTSPAGIYVKQDTGTFSFVNTPLGLALRTNSGAINNNASIFLTGTGRMLEGAAQATLAFYLRIHTVNRDTANESIIYEEWPVVAAARTMLFRYEPGGGGVLDGFVFTGSQIGGDFSSATSMEDGEFHVCILRYDGVELSCWFDGVKDPTTFAATGTLGEGSGAAASLFGPNPVQFTTDGGQFDVLTGIIDARAWHDDFIRLYSRDPFGPFRMADDGSGVLFGIAAVVAAVNRGIRHMLVTVGRLIN